MKRVNIRAMRQGIGELVELYLENGLTGGRLLCPQNLVPEPGEYLLAHDPAFLAYRGLPAPVLQVQAGRADAPLPVPVFNAGPVPGGFLVAPPIPLKWQPGTVLSLRGPLGRGFSLPTSALHVALIALGETSARLNPLLVAALGQSASVAVVSDLDLSDLPSEVEIQPVSALSEVAKWADYLAFDLPREALPGLREKLGLGEQAKVPFEAQALVVTPMPCGGMAECGVCAVPVHRGWKMACKDGPVFDLDELI